MKELYGVARNLCIAVSDKGKRIPQAEVIILVSETVWNHSTAGGISPARETTGFRFVSDAKGLRAVAKDLMAYAKELDAMEQQEGDK